MEPLFLQFILGFELAVVGKARTMLSELTSRASRSCLRKVSVIGRNGYVWLLIGRNGYFLHTLGILLR